MTAEEIRELRTDAAKRGLLDTKAFAALEIAAQLAELNELLRRVIDEKGFVNVDTGGPG